MRIVSPEELARKLEKVVRRVFVIGCILLCGQLRSGAEPKEVIDAELIGCR